MQSLVVNEVMTEKPGRQYLHFKGFPRNALNSTNLAGLCKWIKEHKNGISIGNYTVREVLMKNRTRVWRNVYNTASA